MSESKDTFAAGLDLSSDMFGKDGVQARLDNATDFTRPFDELVTRYCFGDVWNRPELDRKTRSIVTLAVLTALTKPNQIKVHVAGAIANGVSKEEIREVIMHSAVYAGIPSGVEAMGAAREMLIKMGLEDDK